jgi:hypothetical protein
LQPLNQRTMINVVDGATTFAMKLPRQAVSLLVLEWK